MSLPFVQTYETGSTPRIDGKLYDPVPANHTEVDGGIQQGSLPGLFRQLDVDTGVYRSSLVLPSHLPWILEATGANEIAIVNLTNTSAHWNEFDPSELGIDVQVHHMPIFSTSHLIDPVKRLQICETISRLRKQGKTVIIHCLKWQSRTWEVVEFYRRKINNRLWRGNLLTHFIIDGKTVPNISCFKAIVATTANAVVWETEELPLVSLPS